MGAAMTPLIKTANKSISRSHSVNYPITLTPNYESAIESLKMLGAREGKFVAGSGLRMSFRDDNHLSNQILFGVATLAD